MGLTVSGYDSSSISTLFSSLNSSSSSGGSSLSSMTSLLGEYNSIQSGSYFKLLRSYYTPKNGTDTTTTTDKDKLQTTDRQMAADKMAAHNLRIITSRFSAIKKASFLTPVMGYKIQLIMMPAVAFFITTTSKSLILAVGYQPFTSHADTENSSVITPLPAGISITPVYISVLSRAVRL